MCEVISSAITKAVFIIYWSDTSNCRSHTHFSVFWRIEAQFIFWIKILMLNYTGNSLILFHLLVICSSAITKAVFIIYWSDTSNCRSHTHFSVFWRIEAQFIFWIKILMLNYTGNSLILFHLLVICSEETLNSWLLCKHRTLKKD